MKRIAGVYEIDRNINGQCQVQDMLREHKFSVDQS